MGWELAVLILAAFFAGFVDAVAGGGGLIQVPALLAGMPTHAPSVLFGTNKLSSVFGTASATWRFMRRLPIDWRVVGPAAASAFVFSFIGAACVTLFPRDLIRPVVFVLLVFLVAYVIWQPSFGLAKAEHQKAPTSLWAALLVGVVLGFYDGFFGPGAGSFLIFCFVRFFGMDFLNASGSSKVVNLATNAAALTYFLPTGNVLLMLGLGMALANVLGAQLGMRAALRGGSVWVRRVFLVVSLVLIAKVGRDLL
jgi:uncharacterized protein